MKQPFNKCNQFPNQGIQLINQSGFQRRLYFQQNQGKVDEFKLNDQYTQQNLKRIIQQYNNEKVIKDDLIIKENSQRMMAVYIHEGMQQMFEIKQMSKQLNERTILMKDRIFD
ncbi:unnamed protein product (macronuclear) [Paramecium tetraurelia]|uniref:Uncharacterized protein n=1 Tax=Paramecium tetraurelia TaxID=5888 RepID=A0BMV3_PARTE|nr:uncharacterized protein GSPATT00030507001 [Paramecium tetraurelia]CAK59870.1 unnamed protein product [Paramecium tetraurelia]|eukprot:XP_001427268.1 hypothetical protein (macronuclear) [Paramecium tetraurelia strain d4-2]